MGARVRIVAGRAGSGKSLWCFRRIVRALRDEPLGPPIYWVVPRQMTFSAERWLTCGSGLGAFSRCRVVSFDGLAEQVIQRAGGAARAVISRAGRLMIVGHLLKSQAESFAHFRASAARPGLAQELISLLDELSRQGVEPEAIDAAAAALVAAAAADPADALLRAKLTDVRRLRDAYDRFLTDGALGGPFDKDSRMAWVLRHLGTCPDFRGATFHVDGFLDLLDFERRMLVGLADIADELNVTFCLPEDSPRLDGRGAHMLPDDDSVFHRVELAHRALRLQLADRGVPVTVERLPKRLRAPSPELRAIESLLAGLPPAAALSGPAIDSAADSATDGESDPAHTAPEHGDRLARTPRPVPAGAATLPDSASTAPAGTATHTDSASPARAGTAAHTDAASPARAGTAAHTDFASTADSPLHTGAAAAPSAVAFVEAPDLASECDAAAREILSLVRDHGYRFRDIVVLARDLTPYNATLSATFTEHGIPHFIDRRRDASCHPLLKLLRSALSIASTGWNTADVVAIAKSGLVPAGVGGAEVASKLENWAIGKGLRGDGWPATHPHAPTDVEQLRATVTSALAPVVGGLRSDEGITVRDACTRLLAMFEALSVRKTLAGWMRDADRVGDHESRAEHLQVWREVMDFLGELTELLGPQVVRAADLQMIVLAGLQGLDLGLTPPTVDQVLVGTADRSRPGDARAAVLLGLSYGLFPLHHQEAALLSDRDRVRLHRLDLPLEGDGERKQLDERLFAYLAFTRPSDRLVLLRHTTDAAGAPLAASAYFSAAHRALGGPPITRVEPQSRGAPGDVSTPRQLAVGLLRWARSLGTDPIPDEASVVWAGLYEQFRRHPADGSPLDLCRHAVWSALGRRNEVRLHPETAAALFPLPLRVTDDQLESFAACPFQHFLKYGLRIKDLEEPEVGVPGVSMLMHSVLDRLCRAMVQRRSNWDAMTEAQAASEIDRLAGEAVEYQVRRLTWDGSADRTKLTPRDRYLLDRVTTLVGKVVRAHRVAATRTTFRPHRSSVRFAEQQEGSRTPDAPPLIIPLTKSGGEVVVSGSIDRVDVSADGSRSAAWDYTYAGKFADLGRIYQGLALRVLIHLLVLRDAAEDIIGSPAEPGGAFVLGLSSPVESFSDLGDYADAPLVTSDDYLLAQRKARGLFDLSAAVALDSGAGPGTKSPLVKLDINKDGSLSKRSTDALTPQQLHALLEHARGKVAELAEHIHAGVADVTPYKINTDSACVRCSYQKVCRFDPRNGDRYCPDIVPLKPADVLASLLTGPSGGDE